MIMVVSFPSPARIDLALIARWSAVEWATEEATWRGCPPDEDEIASFALRALAQLDGEIREESLWCWATEWTP